jgi:hypothetical protein
MSTQPYDAWKPPKPHHANGEPIQVTVFHDEFGHIVERWQLSDTDVRWYKLEKWRNAWVTMKVEKQTAVA